MEMSRRGFIKWCAAAAAAVTLPGRVAEAVLPAVVEPAMFFPKGQAVLSWMISIPGSANDFGQPVLVELFRKSKPDAPLYKQHIAPGWHFSMQMPVGREYIIPAGDQLEWRTSVAGEGVPPIPKFHAISRCLATGKLFTNENIPLEPPNHG